MLEEIRNRLPGQSPKLVADRDLNGQVVLITGGTRGLGLLLARQFAREGCKLVICARDEDELKRARDEFEPEGTPTLTVKCDIADRAEVEKMVGAATERFGRIDILVNNAGIIQVGPVQAMTVENFEEAMAIDFWGAVYTTLTVLPQMRERKSGRIVNISSIGGRVAIPHLLPYSAAKFATTGFSEGLRAELAPDGISVTTILPGVLRTGSHLNAYYKGDPEQEFGWFGTSASLPFVSMQPERAAQQIVEAAKNRQPERVLSLQAVILARLHGLFPATATRLFTLVNRLALPADRDSQSEQERGMNVKKSSFQKVLTSLGETAARQLRQFPGPSATLEASREAQKKSQ